MSTESTIAIIAARGGSKGIPKKNLINFCGHPLIAWSIRQALNCEYIKSVWVSSDDKDILDISKKYGANALLRPDELSSDTSTSESAWLHILDFISSQTDLAPDKIVALQATSPLRSSEDLTNALKLFDAKNYDSLLSVSEVEDFFNWKLNNLNQFQPINYDYKFRKPRQLLEKHYLENGSFYIFKPSLIKTTSNRLGGHIGYYVMDKYKMFQIDNIEDLKLCSVLMTNYDLDLVIG